MSNASWIVAAVAIAPPVYLLALYLLNIINRDELRLLGGGAGEREAAPLPTLDPVTDVQPVA